MNVLCMGETLLRYSTKKGYRFTDLSFDVHVGGSETNIAVSLANFGFTTSLFSKVSDNALGDAIIHFLNSYQVNTKQILRSSQRVGSYYLENGSGNRASQVIYDREGSAMTTLTKEEVDISSICKDIDAFVVSGITLALSKEIQEIIIEIMKYCNQHNITVIYDSNYRAKLWTTKEAGIAFKKVLPYVNILSAGHLDAINLLGLTSDKKEHQELLKDVYQQICNAYPNITYITSTKRDIISSSVNDITAYLYHKGTLYTSATYHIDDIVDRVGGGDAFMAGMLQGLLHNKEIDYCLDFAVGATVLKHTIHGDANQFTVQEIDSFIKNGVSRIVR